MLSLLLAYGLTWFLVQQAQTYFIAAELRPTTRPITLWLLQTNLVTLVFSIALLISYRPWLAGIISLAVGAIFLVVNQAKYKALAEPLVFSDIYLYLQVFTHPRLFLPFLNLPLTIASLLIGLSLLYTAAILEPALSLSRLNFSSIVVVIIVVLTGLSYKISITSHLSFDPNTDITTLGFFNSLIIYSVQAKQLKNLQELQTTIRQESPYTQANPELPTRPDIITIQSESFFDARSLTKAIEADVLQNFDFVKNDSLLSGNLQVPAWGANTLRTEYAFLSGIDNQKLKYYRYNPYQFLQKESSPSLASYLKALGYWCICIHPNHSEFFKRNKAFPLLGFDEFIDIGGFDTKQTAGPYISDQAVALKIQNVLAKRATAKPLFIFAITMENHGPLHLENYEPTDLAEFYQAEPPKQHHDLTVYLKHLKNTDQMLANLTNYLKNRSTASFLCWYGDHVPSMPDVYKELSFQDGRSDYLIWSNQNTPVNAKSKDLAIEDLGVELLNLAGLRVANER
ncbi:MAG TPA: LTA synthase family protein [Thiolinea sp.]|nr:LTA synthase family protein [Thiolinea sp.]